MIKLLYFAGLREALGVSAEELALPAEVTTVAGLRRHLAGRGEPWGTLIRNSSLKAAVNQAMAGPEAAVADGDEVAFFPPVTGG
jgi:molybdopterin synthase sulfur carrier subunit